MIAGPAIDDMDLPRHGGMSRMCARVRAPSTLGTFRRLCVRLPCAVEAQPEVAQQAPSRTDVGDVVHISSLSVDTLSIHDRVGIVPGADPTSLLPLPQAQFHVLAALTQGDMHGYAIMQAVEGSSNGVVRMGPATLYGTLKRLVEQGLAEELPHRPAPDDDQRRRYYRLSGLGRQVCVAEADRLASLVRLTRHNLRPRTI